MPQRELREGLVNDLDGYGSREITPEDRRRAVLHELANSRSNVRITEGMRRALRERHRPPRWWWAVMAVGLIVACLLLARLVTVMW
jgi:hypothetical protein